MRCAVDDRNRAMTLALLVALVTTRLLVSLLAESKRVENKKLEKVEWPYDIGKSRSFVSRRHCAGKIR